MSELINNTPAARLWADEAAHHYSASIFGKIVIGVIWTDSRGEDGEYLIPVDPLSLVNSINQNPYILLHNHDPGKPIGKVLKTAAFVTEDGCEFIVAVLGYYIGGDVLSFEGLGIDTGIAVPPPIRLAALSPDCWIEIAVDPREVDSEWLDEAASGAPLRVVRIELSHNSAEAVQELIRISVVYVALVWNPFVTSIATEAGKDTYALIHKWIRKLLERLSDRRNPILVVQSVQNGCQVSFIVRGVDVKQHYSAHDALSDAAAQAAQLIANLKSRGQPAQELTYEFDKDALRWFPSFAILLDGRIITERFELIAVEQLPAGLSLGLRRCKKFLE